LTRRGSYLAIEAVLAQKGCAPLAAFIDLTNGQVAENVVLDHAWDHRFDAHPENFAGQPYRVTQAERVLLTQAAFKGNDGTPTMLPWPFALIHATDAEHETHLFAYCTDCSFPWSAPRSEALPSIGSVLSAGASRNYPDRSVVRFFDAERVLFLSPEDERRYAALQTPTPPDSERGVRRNMWFDAADDDAYNGNFSAAVQDFRTMLSYENDARLYASEAQMLRQCEALAAKVRAGQITAKTAGTLFPNGCKTN
jgi:hypothetical protein